MTNGEDICSLHKAISTSDDRILLPEQAKDFFRAVITEVENIKHPVAVFIVCSEVYFIAQSAANQICYFWNRVQKGEFDGTERKVYLVLYKLNEDVRATLNNTLSVGATKNTMLYFNNRAEFELIGHTESINIETWRYVYQQRQVSAKTMSQDLNSQGLRLNKHACRNRLRILSDKRLIRRFQRDREYIYCPVLSVEKSRQALNR